MSEPPSREVQRRLPLRCALLRDDDRSSFEDDLRGAVILLEADGFGVGEILLELEDVADVGAAPGVDALVLVAHHADVLVLAAEQLHQLVLGAVGVLVFVDEEIAVAAVVTLAHFGRDLEQPHGLEQEVVEVEGVGLPQLLAVALEDVRDLLADRVGGLQVELLRIDHVVLGPGDFGEDDARRELLVVEAHAPHDGFDHRLLVGLVVDGEAAGEAFVVHAQRFDVAAEHAHAEGVKRGDERPGQRAVANELVDALRHFGGGFVGEGDGEDGIRRDAALVDEVRDAVGDDARLAGAGAGKDKHRAVDGFDAFTLLRIQFVEKMLQGVACFYFKASEDAVSGEGQLRSGQLKSG